ncbi:Protein of unknown function [Nakamurella panacisegetis]|uniref:DUF3071 domain-containing protein n=1 Tax=Nakamurella panacisegetis TaxID=1090615 RepID=A0A1H0J3Q1_9ACTN|nr:septation protein SepH [Nakamurella panacisegetis]SDO37971.1 Protein of unknown function [Nakamurella panacisegetis]
MRALRVLGLSDAPVEGAEKGSVKNLVCEDPVTGEQFSIPCDDRLKAGARGDLSRFGQLEIEMESQLRPREIQARIRSGATVEQVAAQAGTTASRVDRFAYPVLLERASVAEKARKARPAIDGITAATSVEDTVAATLAARGHDGDVTWDAFKDDEGWILALTWHVGRSENRAHWVFHPGSDGGTLSARDDAAAEIVDPALRILRPLRPVRPDTVPTVLIDPTVPTEPSRPVDTAPRSGHPAGSKLTTAPKPAAQQPRTPRPSRFGVDAAATEPSAAERIVEETVTDERTGVNPVITRREEVRTGTEPVRAASTPSPAARSSAAKSSRKGSRPAMPSWEDVLLGTRSNGH